MRRFVLACVFFASFSTPSFAKFYEENCWNEVVTKRVMLRKYDHKYNWGSSDTLTKGQEGSLHVTSQNTTQGSTAVVDPGYTTGYSQAQLMSTSSKKPCNYLGASTNKERDQFTAANGDGLKRDIARGDGQNLRAFALLSGCNETVLTHYFAAMRSQYDALAPLSAERGDLPQAMDQIVARDQQLAGACKL